MRSELLPVLPVQLLSRQLGCLGLCQLGLTGAVLQGGAEGGCIKEDELLNPKLIAFCQGCP